MGQKKLQRFAELQTFPNVLQFPQEIGGKWNDFFKTQHPITLELACGKGEYALGLGLLYNDRNLIGIDLKGNRIWVGAKKALELALPNVAFLRIQIEMIDKYFAKDEVAEIWITFPDPQLRLSKSKKRLTHPRFLRLYKKILQPKGIIHLKTDSPDLYHFTKTVINLYQCPLCEDRPDLYNTEELPADLQIRTHYERQDIAGTNQVYYLSFQLPEALAGEEMDRELKISLEKENEGID